MEKQLIEKLQELEFKYGEIKEEIAEIKKDMKPPVDFFGENDEIERIMYLKVHLQQYKKEINQIKEILSKKSG